MTFSGRLDKHMETHGPAKYDCPECGKGLMNVYGLQGCQMPSNLLLKIAENRPMSGQRLGGPLPGVFCYKKL